jgi:hypothetical protein
MPNASSTWIRPTKRPFEFRWKRIKQGNLNFAGCANHRIGIISSDGVIMTVAGGGEVSGFFFEPET